MKKSLFIGTLAAGMLLAAGLTSCSKKTAAAEGAQAQKVVRINYQTGNLCGAPVHVAWKLGLFDEELAKIGQKAEYPIFRVVETDDVVTFLEVNLYCCRLPLIPITGRGLDGLDEFAVDLDGEISCLT